MFRFFLIAPLLSAQMTLAAPQTAAFLDQHCMECHDADVKKAGLDLTALTWKPEEGKNFDTWVKVFDRVSKGEMPPAKKARPASGDVQSFLTALRSPLHDHSANAQAKTGRTILRRLNRSEYENTLHDLLGIELPLKDMLPEDGSAHGFDTVADGLRLSTLHLEKYLEAADEALDAAIVLTKKPEKKKGRYSYKDEKNIQKNLALPDDPPSDPKKKYSRERQVFRDLPDAIVMFTSADYLLGLSQARIERDGTYRVRASAYAYQSNGKDVNLRFYSNNFREKRLLGSYDVPPDKPRLVEFTARIQQGEHLLLTPTGVGIAADGQKLSDSDTTKEYKGTGLAVQWVEVEGPIEADEWPPRSLANLFGDTPLQPLDPKKMNKWDKNAVGYEIKPADPTASVKPLLDRFAGRAFRRPLDPGETDRFVKLVQTSLQSGDDFVSAMRIGFRAILTAPQFLLFDEAPGKLGDHALASRLSYFLWSTLPDERLLRLASEKKLSQAETLRAEVLRMIEDPRATAFVTNFTGQWLDLRGIDATTPDPRLYPEFDEMLKRAMVAESEGFFREMLRRNLPVTNIIQSDFVMLNSRLAEHYGIPDVRGEKFRPVKLTPDSPRGGVLTQASVLKVTANGTVTSPVLRGAWVMKRILADPPAPPPPNVGSVEPDTRGATTIRELLDKHRNAESCMGCHSKMDPPGFALEGFDVIGGVRDRYRSKEKGDRPPGTFENRGIWQYKLALPVDTTGQLPDGRKFTGIRDFKQLLASDPARICQALATKLLTYSTGAGISFADRAEVSRIADRTLKQGGGLRDLVTEIVLSPTFQSK